MFSRQFNRFKEIHILLIKEHHINSGLPLIDLIRIASQDPSFQYDM
jgi:hypothetical protein